MNKISKAAQKELNTLKAKTEDTIDFSDIAETNASTWQDAKRSQFYRPTKQQLTVRIDSDVLAWLKSQGKGYQSRLNEILRGAMHNK